MEPARVVCNALSPCACLAEPQRRAEICIAVLLQGWPCLEPLLFSLFASFQTCCAMTLSIRLNRGLSKSKDSKDMLLSPSASCFQRENLPEWPLPIELPQHSIGTPTSMASFKPLPDLSSRPLPPIRDIDIASPHVDQFLAERSPHETVNRNISTTNGSTGVLKKVAINSPPPSLTDKATTTIRPPSADPVKPRYDGGSFLPPTSWSESVAEDLVSHLGPSERARQEILWEIVASEER